jgi:hypothetical protein
MIFFYKNDVTNQLRNSYLCNELQNERLFCTRHDISCAKNSHFGSKMAIFLYKIFSNLAKNFIQ